METKIVVRNSRQGSMRFGNLAIWDFFFWQADLYMKTNSSYKYSNTVRLRDRAINMNLDKDDEVEPIAEITIVIGKES